MTQSRTRGQNAPDLTALLIFDPLGALIRIRDRGKLVGTWQIPAEQLREAADRAARAAARLDRIDLALNHFERNMRYEVISAPRQLDATHYTVNLRPS